MNRTLPRVTLFSVIIAVLAAGCASTGGDVKYVDAGSTRTLVSLDKLNLQDLNQAAEAMITSLRENFINAGKLSGTGPNGLAVLKIERIINDTSEQWDSDLLTKKIRIDLNRTGKVATSTTFGNDAESKIGQELAQERQFLNKGGGVLNPDYTLTGKVIEDTNRNGNKREKVYFFHLARTDMRNGLAIWEEEKAIVKQGSRSSVGW
jgi:uncharacterized protein (TIGR02722 family)